MMWVNSEKGKKSEKNVWKSMTMHERFIIKKKEFIEFEKNFFNFVDVKM